MVVLYIYFIFGKYVVIAQLTNMLQTVLKWARVRNWMKSWPYLEDEIDKSENE